MTAAGPTEKLSFWRKVGFGVGDIYGGGSLVVLSFYYLYFLTDVIRINPALAGVVILISKVYDSITDPFEGIITDRTRTRFGRRRPYLLAGVILIFISFYALWYPVNYSEEWQRFLFVVLAYLFFSTVVSLVMLSYNALASELSLDYNERTSLSSFRILFSSIASIISAVVPLEIVKQYGDIRQGYMVMAVIFGIFYAVPMLITFFSTRERVEFQRPVERFNWKDAFIVPFRVRTFVFALLMYLLAFVAMDAVSSIVIYFMKYFLGRGDEANYVSGTLLVAQMAALPFFVILSRRTNKKRGYMVGAAIWAVTMLTSFLITPAAPNYFVYVFAAMVGLGTGGIVVMIYAIFPDIPDVDELKTGRRREGMYMALVTFMRKLSSAVAIFIVSLILALTGYLPPVEIVQDGVLQIVEQEQPATFILGLRLVFALAPIVLLGLALLAASRYPLTGEIHQRLSAVLNARRRGEEETLERSLEAQALGLLLIGRSFTEEGEPSPVVQPAPGGSPGSG
jgi:oligogalacturonide transporter